MAPQPNPRTDTRGPFRPIVRYCIVLLPTLSSPCQGSLAIVRRESSPPVSHREDVENRAILLTVQGGEERGDGEWPGREKSGRDSLRKMAATRGCTRRIAAT